MRVERGPILKFYCRAKRKGKTAFWKIAFLLSSLLPRKYSDNNFGQLPPFHPPGGRIRGAVKIRELLSERITWWTFRIFFIFFLLGKGEGGVRGVGTGGVVGFLLKMPGEGGFSRRGRGLRGWEGVCGKLGNWGGGGRAKYFFSGPKCPPRLLSFRRNLVRTALASPWRDLPEAPLDLCLYLLGREACGDRTLRSCLQKAPATARSNYAQRCSHWDAVCLVQTPFRGKNRKNIGFGLPRKKGKNWL